MSRVRGIDIGHPHEHVDIGKIGRDPHVGVDASHDRAPVPQRVRARREHDDVATTFDRALVPGPAGHRRGLGATREIVGSTERRTRMGGIGRERQLSVDSLGGAGERASQREVEGHFDGRWRPCGVGRPFGSLGSVHEIDLDGGECVPFGPVVLQHALFPPSIVIRQGRVGGRRRRKLDLAERREALAAVGPRANHDLLVESRARSSSDLQPRERVEYALTGHVEPAADVKTGNLR